LFLRHFKVLNVHRKTSRITKGRKLRWTARVTLIVSDMLLKMVGFEYDS
jgi:hypothetical protein